MPSCNQHLMLPLVEGNEAPGGSSPRKFATWVLVAAVALCLTFSLGVCIGLACSSPAQEQLAPAVYLMSEPELVHYQSGRLHWMYAPFTSCAPVCVALGLILFGGLFLAAGIKHAMDFKDFVRLMQGFGLPAPTVWAVLGLLFAIGGGVMVITGIPILVEGGCELILFFLLFATYFGHFKPWRQNKDETQMQLMVKNVALIGACLVIIGVELEKL